MTTYYVISSGSDSNPGTQAQPWRTIQTHVYDNTVKGGDTVIIQGAITLNDANNCMLFLINRQPTNASPTNPVIIQGAPGNVITSPGGIEGYGSNRYWTFDGLNLRMDPARSAGEGIYFDGHRPDKEWGGTSSNSGGCGYLTVKNCTLDVSSTGYINRNGIGLWHGDYLTVQRNKIFHSSSDTGYGGGSAISIGQPQTINSSTGTHVLIDSNIIAMIGPGDAANATDRNGIILDEYHTDSSGGPSAAAFPNFGGGHAGLVGDTVVTNNILTNITGRGIHVLKGGYSLSRIVIANNTVIGPFAKDAGNLFPQCGIGGYGDNRSSNVLCFNNLVMDGNLQAGAYNFYPGGMDTGNWTCANNWSYNGNNTTSNGNMTVANINITGSTNPNLVNKTTDGLGNYRPSTGSPVIAAGVASLSGYTAPTVDYYGQPRSGARTIGAAEPAGGAVATPPTAAFTFSPGTATTGQTVTFADASTGVPTSWLWNFGDGTTSTTQSPTRTWSLTGTKTITLTATNSLGSNSTSQTIVITATSGLAPVSNFTFSPSPGTAGTAVVFTDTSTNTPTSWSWTFGDGGTATTQNPSRTFATAGTFQVVHTATNASGTSSVTKAVTVNPVSGGGGGTAINLLTLFKSTYPCSVSQTIYVDGNSGNDSNPGTTSAPLRSINAGFSRASAGTEIIVRAATYGALNRLGCRGTVGNWIRMICDPGARISRVPSGGGDPANGILLTGGGYTAIYGLEIQGSQDIESGDNFDTGINLKNGNNIAIWKCHIYNCGSHGISSPTNQGTFACADAMYNLIHDCGNWDPYAGSAISFLTPNGGGTAASDGFSYRVIGNVIYYANELVTNNAQWGITDGNAIIFDQWQGYGGRGLCAFNLCVGNGGRAIHEVNSSGIEFYFNTGGDGCYSQTGTGDADLSMQDGSNNKMQYNIGFARPGWAIVGLAAGGTWSNNLILRGTIPSAASTSSIDKTAVGPLGYFVNYTTTNRPKAAQSATGSGDVTVGTVIAASDWRPKDAQATTVAPPTDIRTLLQNWPDYYGFLRPAGNWNYGALENPAQVTGGGGTVPPVASWTISPSTPVQGSVATFTDTSSNTPTSWSWTFGDGGASTSRNPTRTYASSGNFVVSLTATNAGGSSVSQQTISVTGSGAAGVPVANFTTSANPIQNAAVTFTDTSTNTPTSWSWNFGDGSAIVTTQNAAHGFSTSGTFNVSHTATNASGSNTTTKQVVVAAAGTTVPGSTAVYQAEDATLLGSNYPTDPYAPHRITDGPGYSGTGYIGYFGQIGQGVRFDVSTTAAGQVTLKFRYRSIAPALRTVLVNGVTIASDATLPTTAATWADNSWSEYSISTTLPASSSTIEFRVNSGVDQYVDLDQLTVVSATSTGSTPVANFSVSLNPTQGNVVTFSDTSVNAPTAWSWTFGDGGTSNTRSPNHVFATAGVFQVTLTATNAVGSNAITKAVTVVTATGGTGTGPRILTTNPGYLGTGYVGFFGQVGQYVRFTVPIATAGQASLKFRYRSTAPELRTVLVNNISVSSDVSWPTTASQFTDNSWNEFVVNATLIAGSNTIEVRVNSGVDQFIDLDQLSIGAVTVPSGTAPVANFVFTPPNPQVGGTVSFTDTSTNTPTTRLWNFGDGVTSTTQNPGHVYGVAGTYQVSLLASNATGSNTITKPVPVTAAPGGVGTSNFLTLFKTKYPCSLSKTLFVDGNTGNDSNTGSSVSPLLTIQAALNQATGGTEITVRAATYAPGNTVGCIGTSGNWVRVIADTGAKIGRVDGSGAQPASSGLYWGGGQYVAFYGFEIQGSQDIESGAGGAGNYDVGVNLINGNNAAIWRCHIHHCGSHGIASPGNQGNFGAVDACYNLIHDVANWDPYAGSGISIFQPANVGTAASDGFAVRVIGNVIYKADEIIGALTDGNAIIFDNWSTKSYTGKGVAAFNLCVGCGGRGVHEMNSSRLEFYYNTCVDNVQRLTGTWDGEISFQSASPSGLANVAQYNIGAARVGRNRVGLNESGHDWNQNLFLRGTGGSEANDPTPANSNSVDKTAIGPVNYFTNYTTANVVTPSDWRPKDNQVTTIAPSTAVRTLLQSWPDYYGVLRGTGAWAYGAFESPSGTGTVVPAPVANFTVSPASPVQGSVATFSDTSTNTPTSWVWDFGDGGAAATQNTTHTYSIVGGSTVVYEAESGTLIGVNTSTNTPRIVTDNPGYSGTGYIGYFGQIGQAVRFGVNSPVTGSASLRFRYRSISASLRTIAVNGAAVATNVSIPASAGAWTDNSWSTYIVTTTLTAGNNTIDFRVDTGVDQYIDLDQLTAVLPGTGTSGLVTVTLTATNSGGSSVSQKTITVQSAGTVSVVPVANFTFNPTSAVTNTVVSLTDTSTNAPTAWSWTFGDGGTSTLQNPTHAWTTAGTKTVTLTASNSVGGNALSRTIVISTPVGAAPIANFTSAPSPGTVGVAQTFTDTSTNTPTAWAWVFGDGATSVVRNPSHTYVTNGNFTVSLTASNAGGSSVIQKSVTIQAPGGGSPPVADFTTSANPTVGVAVTFTDTSTNSPTSWSWDFGDGVPPSTTGTFPQYQSSVLTEMVGFAKFGGVTGGQAASVATKVTNTNDSGTGSLRAALTGGSDRWIVFDRSVFPQSVETTIALSSPINMRNINNITVDGFGARVRIANYGITTADWTGSGPNWAINVSNNLCFINLKMATTVAGNYDNFTIDGTDRLWLYHVECFGGGDGNLDITLVAQGPNAQGYGTLQNCYIHDSQTGKGCLIGDQSEGYGDERSASSGYPGGGGDLKLTIVDSRFKDVLRNPVIFNSHVHQFNNYYHGWTLEGPALFGGMCALRGEYCVLDGTGAGANASKGFYSERYGYADPARDYRRQLFNNNVHLGGSTELDASGGYSNPAGSIFTIPYTYTPQTIAGDSGAALIARLTNSTLSTVGRAGCIDRAGYYDMVTNP